MTTSTRIAVSLPPRANSVPQYGKTRGNIRQKRFLHCSVSGFSVRVILSVEELSVWK